ncbi:MAG: tetratricopeptide repeat protein, partial [Bacteroidales bacterium]
MFRRQEVKSIGKSLVIALLFLLMSLDAHPQQDEGYNLFLEFIEYYKSGNFIKAEECMNSVLKSKAGSNADIILPYYNNMGLIRKSLGLYDEALDFYDKSEEIALQNPDRNILSLAGIYTNKSRIYTFQRSLTMATEYLGKAIRIYRGFKNPDKAVLNSLSGAYLNIGIAYYELADYKVALENLNRSQKLKLENNLPEIELTYLNLARVNEKLNLFKEADTYYTKCLKTIRENYGSGYFRMAEIYFGYGTFLDETGKTREALAIFKKALDYCLSSYGEKHAIVSLAFNNLGDFYLKHNDLPLALENYQASIIAITPDFGNKDILSNPSVDSSLLDIRLLDVLDSKAEALYIYQASLTDSTLKNTVLRAGLETVILAVSLADRIRNNYPTEESRLFLVENEKATALLGVKTAALLYELNGDSSYVTKMYGIVLRSKAAILLDEMTSNKFLPLSGIPDSLIRKRKSLGTMIGAYKNLIMEETGNMYPDNEKIAHWQDVLFDTRLDLEKLETELGRNYPQYRYNLSVTKRLSVDQLQKRIRKGETI